MQSSGAKDVKAQEDVSSQGCACVAAARLGRIEYVVESRHDGDIETWLIIRPLRDVGPQLASYGMAFTPGCRIVIEAASLRPVGVLEADLPPAASPAGFNPYFDLRPA